MINLLITWWYAWQRAVDRAVLWPECYRIAADKGLSLDDARVAFSLHAYLDPAWASLGEVEFDRQIKALEPPR